MTVKKRFDLSGNMMTLKLFMTGFLVLLFFIPLSMVKNVIQERSQYRNEAIQSISDSWAGPQKIWGPVLVVPYNKAVEVTRFDAVINKTIRSETTERQLHIVLPKTLQIKATVDTETRYRGIYQVPVYVTHLTMTGDFTNIAASLPGTNAKVTFTEKPYLAFGLSDIRGIGADITVKWNKADLETVAGSGVSALPDGFRTPLQTAVTSLDQGHIDVTLNVKGVQSLNIVPVGQKTTMHMESAWPHPRFDGKFLPSTRDVKDSGFSADWETGLLATNMESLFKDCHVSCAVTDTSFGVSFFQPVDVYQKTIRAAKYAILLILLTFVSFFMFEALQRLRIHPIQYTLVGAALALFYLILLSLSEHLPFSAAYGVSVGVILGLLWFYIGAVLKSVRAGWLFTGMLAIIYAIIYVILMSSDYALLLGTGLVFVVLTLIMVVTRRVDWYALGQQDKD